MTSYLFVYGTLLPDAIGDLGARERGRLRVGSVYLGSAHTQGCLLDLGGYPAMMMGTGVVHGGVYDLAMPDQAFIWLDAYEGISGSPGDEYARHQIPVTLASGNSVTAWTYMFLRSAAPWPIIVSGRWGERRLP